MSSLVLAPHPLNSLQAYLESNGIQFDEAQLQEFATHTKQCHVCSKRLEQFLKEKK
jgi:hypothetical protein